MDMNGQELDPAQQKQHLLQEIESLENQYRQLQNQIKIEQDTARTDIDQW